MMTYADGFHSHSVIGIALVVGSASMSALYKVGAGSGLAGSSWPGRLGALGEPWMELVLEHAHPAPRASRCGDVQQLLALAFQTLPSMAIHLQHLG